jgi:hypothetical protein
VGQGSVDMSAPVAHTDRKINTRGQQGCNYVAKHDEAAFGGSKLEQRD